MPTQGPFSPFEHVALALSAQNSVQAPQSRYQDMVKGDEKGSTRTEQIPSYDEAKVKSQYLSKDVDLESFGLLTFGDKVKCHANTFKMCDTFNKIIKTGKIAHEFSLTSVERWEKSWRIHSPVVLLYEEDIITL